MTTTTIFRDLTVDEAREVIFDLLHERDDVAAQPIEQFSDDAIVRLMKAASLAIAQLEAVHVRGVAVLDRRRGDPEGVRDLVAKELRISGREAADLLATAQALEKRLPETLSLVESGVVRFGSAAKVAKATAWLSDADAAITDAILAPRLQGKNVDQVHRAARYAADAVDPVGAIRRVAQNREGRRVKLTKRNSAVASLSIRAVSAEKAAAAFASIESRAEALKAPDETRTHDQLCADVALELLTKPVEGDAAASSGNAAVSELPLRIPVQRSESSVPADTETGQSASAERERRPARMNPRVSPRGRGRRKPRNYRRKKK